MKYILRNLIRLRKNSILLFLFAVLVMILSSFGVFVAQLCKETEARSFGPLYGYYYVTNDDNEVFLGYSQLKKIREHSNVISDIQAERRLKCILKGASYIGEGRYVTTELKINYSTMKREEVTGEFVHGFMLIGTTSTEICEEFYSGTTVITEGSGISEYDNENGFLKVVVSDSFANQNGLSIGDLINVNIWSLIVGYDYSKYSEDVLPLSGGIKADTIFVPFTIGGIYHTYKNNTISCAAPSEDANNALYIPISSMDDLLGMYDDTENNRYCLNFIVQNLRLFNGYSPTAAMGMLDRAYIKISSNRYASALEERINAIGFYDNVKLTLFTSDSTGLPSSRIFRIVSSALFVIMAAGFVMLVLILIFSIISRKREFNCLVALGKSRARVALSYFGEVAVIILIALIISSMLFGLIVFIFGGTISESLNNADSTFLYINKRSADVLTPNVINAIRNERMLDFANLRDTYILPTFALTSVATASVLAAILIVVMLTIKRINVLRAMGEGKL